LTSLVLGFFYYCSHFSYLSARTFGWLCGFVVLSDIIPKKIKALLSTFTWMQNPNGRLKPDISQFSYVNAFAPVLKILANAHYWSFLNLTWLVSLFTLLISLKAKQRNEQLHFLHLYITALSLMTWFLDTLSACTKVTKQCYGFFSNTFFT
jgi:hypothetical protein